MRPRASTPTTAGRSSEPAPPGCCWPRAPRWTSSRSPPPSGAGCARCCARPGWPSRSRRPPPAVVVPGHAGRDAAGVAARAGRRRPAHRRRRGPRPAVGDPGRLGALAGRPRPHRLPSVTGGPIVAAITAAVEMHESDRLPAVAGRLGRRDVARLVPGAADRRSAPGTRGRARSGAAPEGALLPRRAAAPPFSAGAGRRQDTGPGQQPPGSSARCESSRQRTPDSCHEASPCRSRAGHYGVVQTSPAAAPPDPSAPRTPRRFSVEAGLGVGALNGALNAEEKARDLRRMKTLATGLLLAATVIFLLARWGEAVGRAGLGRVTCGRRPRPRWSARWPTGSPSPRSSARRWACRSRTPRSSRARRTRSATASATSSARTSWPRTSCATSSGASRSRGGSASGSGRCPTPTGSPPSSPTAARGVVTVLRDDDVQEVIDQVLVRKLLERRPARRWARCWRACSPTAATTASST